MVNRLRDVKKRRMNLISDVCAVTSSDIVRDIGHNLDLEDEAGALEVGAEEVRM